MSNTVTKQQLDNFMLSIFNASMPNSSLLDGILSMGRNPINNALSFTKNIDTSIMEQSYTNYKDFFNAYINKEEDKNDEILRFRSGWKKIGGDLKNDQLHWFPSEGPYTQIPIEDCLTRRRLGAVVGGSVDWNNALDRSFKKIYSTYKTYIINSLDDETYGFEAELTEAIKDFMIAIYDSGLSDNEKRVLLKDIIGSYNNIIDLQFGRILLDIYIKNTIDNIRNRINIFYRGAYTAASYLGPAPYIFFSKIKTLMPDVKDVERLELFSTFYKNFTIDSFFNGVLDEGKTLDEIGQVSSFISNTSFLLSRIDEFEDIDNENIIFNDYSVNDILKNAKLFTAINDIFVKSKKKSAALNLILNSSEISNCCEYYINHLNILYLTLTNLRKDFILNSRLSNVVIETKCGPKHKIINPFNDRKIDISIGEVYTNTDYGDINSAIDEIKSYDASFNINAYKNEDGSNNEDAIWDKLRVERIAAGKKVWAEIDVLGNCVECPDNAAPRSWVLCEKTPLYMKDISVNLGTPDVNSSAGNIVNLYINRGGSDCFNEAVLCCENKHILEPKIEPEINVSVFQPNPVPPTRLARYKDLKDKNCDCDCYSNTLEEEEDLSNFDPKGLMPCANGCLLSSPFDLLTKGQGKKFLAAQIAYNLFNHTVIPNTNIPGSEDFIDTPNFICASIIPPDKRNSESFANLKIDDIQSLSKLYLTSKYQWNYASCEWECKDYYFGEIELKLSFFAELFSRISFNGIFPKFLEQLRELSKNRKSGKLYYINERFGVKQYQNCEELWELRKLKQFDRSDYAGDSVENCNKESYIFNAETCKCECVENDTGATGPELQSKFKYYFDPNKNTWEIN
jgi:hypothetical protein